MAYIFQNKTSIECNKAIEKLRTLQLLSERLNNNDKDLSHDLANLCTEIDNALNSAKSKIAKDFKNLFDIIIKDKLYYPSFSYSVYSHENCMNEYTDDEKEVIQKILDKFNIYTGKSSKILNNKYSTEYCTYHTYAEIRFEYVSDSFVSVRLVVHNVNINKNKLNICTILAIEIPVESF